VSDAWYNSLPEDYFRNEENDAYKASFDTIRKGIEEGLGFDAACEKIQVEDASLREQIISDMFKVLIAEEHFAKRVPVEDLAKRLQIDPKRIEKTRDEMLDEIQGN